MTDAQPAESFAVVEGYPLVFDTFLAEVDDESPRRAHAPHRALRRRHRCDTTTAYLGALTSASFPLTRTCMWRPR